MLSKQRIYVLDILKFFSAILIVFHHFQQIFEVVFPKINFYNGVVDFGYLVDLFFMLSGFFSVISYNSSCKHTFKSYFINKLIRLFPMVWITVSCQAVIFLLYRFIIGEWVQALWAPGTVGICQYLSSMLLLFNNGILGIDIIGINNPLWYLSVLVIMYILFWFEEFISAKKNINIKYIYLLTILVFLSIRNYGLNIPVLNSRLARGAIPFFIGTLLSTIHEKLPRCKTAFISAFILGVLIIIGHLDYPVFYDDPQMILTFIFFPLLILFTLSSRTMSFLFNNRISGELGKIAFESYLWHSPIFYFIKLLQRVINFSLNCSYLTMITITLIVLLWATLMYYIVEQPLTQKLRCKFSNLL